MSGPTGASNATEIEQTLTMLSGHRSVLGYMVLSRGGAVSIVKHSGVVFEGDQGRKYAGVIERIVDSVQTGLEEISGEQNEGVGRALSLPRARRADSWCRMRYDF
jgi:dynein light chain roadblock-type